MRNSSFRPIRVLHVVPDLGFGGLQRLVTDLCSLLAHHGFETHILDFGVPCNRSIPDGVTVHRPPPMSRLSLLRPAALASLLRDIAPDVLHTHSGIWYKAARAGRMAGIRRLVHTEHGRRNPDPWRQRLVDHLASRCTDAVIAVSQEAAVQLRASVVCRATRVGVIFNGVDIQKFSPGRGTLRRQLGVDDNVPILGSIGRFEALKDYVTMIDAFTALQRTWRGGPRPRLVLAGDGTQRRHLEQLADARGVRTLVEFLGWRTDTAAILRDVTLFVLTSRSEGTSIALLEAMSAGLCVVVTDVGGNRAVLGPELGHRLAPAGSPGAIAALWHAAIHDAEARHRDGAAARRRVHAAFTLDRTVKEYAAVYRSPTIDRIRDAR